ncbi:MAG: efflux RND transporter periplasmic adaptor subunit [Limisphaerales bacterium]
MNRNQRLGSWGLATVVLLLASGCGQNPFARKSPPATNQVESTIPVEVVALQRGPIESFIRTSTHLEAESEVKVFARTVNRVTGLRVEEGSLVKKGDILLSLEDDMQKTQFDKAENNLEKAQREFERSEALHEQKLISEQAYSDVQFERRQRQLAFDDARRELEFTRVEAPISGTVTRRHVKAGDLVNLNQLLFDLVDFDSIIARVHVPERELPRLRVNQPVRVTSTALPGQQIVGHIDRIAPIVETKTGTVKVTVAFKDVGVLRPGMYVNLEIVTATRTDALRLSKRALVLDSDQTYVYRIGPDRRAERRLVQPRIADGEHVEPEDGFAEGDLIVVAGQTGLKDGVKVRLPGDPDPDAKPADKAAAVASPATPQPKS